MSSEACLGQQFAGLLFLLADQPRRDFGHRWAIVDGDRHRAAHLDRFAAVGVLSGDRNLILLPSFSKKAMEETIEKIVENGVYKSFIEDY